MILLKILGKMRKSLTALLLAIPIAISMSSTTNPAIKTVEDMVRAIPPNTKTVFNEKTKRIYPAINAAECRGEQNPQEYWARVRFGSTALGPVQLTLGKINELRRFSMAAGLNGEDILITSEEYETLMEYYSRTSKSQRGHLTYIGYGQPFDPTPEFKSAYETVSMRFIGHRLNRGRTPYQIAAEWRFGLTELRKMSSYGEQPYDKDPSFFRAFNTSLNQS